MALSDFVNLVKNKIQLESAGNRAPDDRSIQEGIEDALVQEFSKDFPRIVTADNIGNGGFDYPLPSNWEEKESVLRSIEYPAGSRTPEMIEPNDWIIRQSKILFHGTVTGGPFVIGETITGSASTATGTVTIIGESNQYVEYIPLAGTFTASDTITGGTSTASAAVSDVSDESLRFLNHTPSTSQVYRITYNVAWTKADLSLIPTVKQKAFCALAAAKTCFILARRHTHDSDNQIVVDSVDHPSKGAEWMKRGRELMIEYNKALDKSKDGKAAPVSITSDWDRNFLWGGDYLNHPRHLT